MPDLKISELTEDTTPATTDTIPLARSGANYRSTLGQALGAFLAANQIVKADTANTPTGLTVAEQTLVGRITSGVITALTAAQVRTLLNVADGADVTNSTSVNAAGAVMESDYNAQTVLVAVSDNTPTAQTVGDSEFVGRPASGNVGVITAAQARSILLLANAVETGTTATFSSASHAFRYVRCSNASGCTVTVNSGTADDWAIFVADAQQVTVSSGTATVTNKPTGRNAVTRGSGCPILVYYRTATIVDVWGDLETT